MHKVNIQITSDCIKEIANIGSTTYQNICNGNVSIVQWGAVDWFISSFLFLFIIIIPFFIFKK